MAIKITDLEQQALQRRAEFKQFVNSESIAALYDTDRAAWEKALDEKRDSLHDQGRFGDLVVLYMEAQGRNTWMRPHLRAQYYIGAKRVSRAKAVEYVTGKA